MTLPHSPRLDAAHIARCLVDVDLRGVKVGSAGSAQIPQLPRLGPVFRLRIPIRGLNAGSGPRAEPTPLCRLHRVEPRHAVAAALCPRVPRGQNQPGAGSPRPEGGQQRRANGWGRRCGLSRGRAGGGRGVRQGCDPPRRDPRPWIYASGVWIDQPAMEVPCEGSHHDSGPRAPPVQAKAVGLALCSTCNHGHVGSAGIYARRALGHGLISWCVLRRACIVAMGGEAISY
jgi:hypothetical protein